MPCFNEATTLAAVWAEFAGIGSVQVLILDDGSTDRTVEVARAAGVEHILSNAVNRGLAPTFARGLEAALERGRTSSSIPTGTGSTSALASTTWSAR